VQSLSGQSSDGNRRLRLVVLLLVTLETLYLVLLTALMSGTTIRAATGWNS
jgi:hypothetical protein